MKAISIGEIEGVDRSTLRTIVNFGLSDIKPPGGSLGAPVTNWRNARLCSWSNSWMISSNCRGKRKEETTELDATRICGIREI